MTDQTQQPANQPGPHYYAPPPQPGQPYGQPGSYWPPVPEPRNALGLTALILGIIGLLFTLMPVTGFIAFGLGVAGLIFGLSNLGRLKRRRATNTVTTGFGIGTSALAVIGGIVGMVLFFQALNQFSNDMDQISDDMDRYSECVDQADTLEQMAECE